MLRRRLLASTAIAAALAKINPAAALLFRGGTGVATVVANLATLTFLNTSGSTQAANFISPIFGHTFKKGDIPSGTAPQFLISGTPQPFSWGCQAYWSDGSLKRASFMLRCTSSIAGSGSLSIGVWSGGTAPSSSARTLTEVYAQSMQVNAVAAAIPSSGANISGTWNAVVANNANNLEQFTYLDGGAGKVWRIMTDFVQSAAAHGQLVCYHYVVALTDSSGNLGGFRVLHRVTQPYYNYDTPAKNYRCFSALNWQHGGGPTTVNFRFPFTAGNFGYDSGTSIWTASAPDITNWQQGTNIDSSHAMQHAYFTVSGGGTLPSPLSLTRAYTVVAETGGLFIYPRDTASIGVSTGIIGTAPGSGTFTLNPVFKVDVFTSLWSADTDAKYDFFQGTGSLSADNTVLVQHDKTYFHATKCIPPLDMAVDGVVPDAVTALDYNVSAAGPVQVNIGSTGGRSDIGAVTGWAATDFFIQNTNTQKIIRIGALASAGFGFGFRDHTTRTIVNVNGPDSSTAYTGMPAANTTLFWTGTPGGTGWTFPPSDCGTYLFIGNTGDHRPELCGYALMTIGEPHMLDLLMEAGNGAIMCSDANRNVTVPYTAYALVTAYNSGDVAREFAWNNRDLQIARGLAPTTSPDGADYKTYFNDIGAANCKFPVDTTSTSFLNAYFNTNRLWTARNQAGTAALNNRNWQTDYFTMAMCYGYGLCEDAYALNWLNDRGVWLTHVGNIWGYWHVYSTSDTIYTTYAGNNDGWPLVTDDAHWSTVLNLFMDWNNTGPRYFTCTAYDYTPTDGDKIILVGPTVAAVPAGGSFALATPYYARDTVNTGVNTWAFNLATAPGGTALIPSNSGSYAGGQSAISANPPAASTHQIPSYFGAGTDFCDSNYMCTGWAIALGATNYSGVRTDATTRLNKTPTQFATPNPKWATQTTF